MRNPLRGDGTGEGGQVVYEGTRSGDGVGRQWDEEALGRNSGNLTVEVVGLAGNSPRGNHRKDDKKGRSWDARRNIFDIFLDFRRPRSRH